MSEPASPAPRVFSIGELAERGGVSRRTVRFYVQRGLLAAPAGGGRGSYYTEKHLETLIRIRGLQEANVPLDEIADHLNERPARRRAAAQAPPEASPVLVWRLEIAPGLELCAAAGRYDAARVAAIAAQIQRMMSPLS